MRLKFAKTKEEKRKALKAYLNENHEKKQFDETCEFYGKIKSPALKKSGVCGMTHNEECTNCRFYSMSVWEMWPKLYDVIQRKDADIMELAEKFNANLNKYRGFLNAVGLLDDFDAAYESEETNGNQNN